MENEIENSNDENEYLFDGGEDITDEESKKNKNKKKRKEYL